MNKKPKIDLRKTRYYSIALIFVGAILVFASPFIELLFPVDKIVITYSSKFTWTTDLMKCMGYALSGLGVGTFFIIREWQKERREKKDE